MTLPSSARLAIRYEELRAHVLHGHDRALLGVAVVRRQGLPVWMTLVGAEETAAGGVAACEMPASPPHSSRPPALVRSELLAAFTDLLIGAALGVQEVS